MGQYGGNFWPSFDLPTVVRKSAFSLKALGQLFSKQPKITCHIVIKSSWGQTRQLQKNWVQIELVEVCVACHTYLESYDTQLSFGLSGNHFSAL